MICLKQQNQICSSMLMSLLMYQLKYIAIIEKILNEEFENIYDCLLITD